MILAEDEVAIGTEHDGIMVLERDGLEPGMPLKDVLPIATDVLVLEITPNRPDCLAIYGVAREVHAATGAPLNPAPWREDPGKPGEVAGAKVIVECPDLCPRFTARVFEDVKIGPSPLWLKARLMAAGQRPISNVVDITNYVMLLTGQPLHAFDLDRVEGATLTVRLAHDGEQVANARRSDTHARLGHGADRGRGWPDLDRGHHGRRTLRGRRGHDARPDGGRELERRQHPSDVAEARAAERGVGPVREGDPA